MTWSRHTSRSAASTRAWRPAAAIRCHRPSAGLSVTGCRPSADRRRRSRRLRVAPRQAKRGAQLALAHRRLADACHEAVRALLGERRPRFLRDQIRQIHQLAHHDDHRVVGPARYAETIFSRSMPAGIDSTSLERAVGHEIFGSREHVLHEIRLEVARAERRRIAQVEQLVHAGQPDVDAVHTVLGAIARNLYDQADPILIRAARSGHDREGDAGRRARGWYVCAVPGVAP